MKVRHLLILCCFVFSCAEKKGDAGIDFADLKLSLDTIRINYGEEIAYLKDGLSISDLSSGGKYLYNVNRGNAEIEKVDLEDMVFVKRIKFEKEGPDGVGAFITGFLSTQDDNFIIQSFDRTGVFDENAKKLKDLDFEKILGEEVSGTVKLNVFEVMGEPNRFLVFYLKFVEVEHFLMDINLEANTFTKVNLEKMDQLKDYTTELMYEGQAVGNTGPQVYAVANTEQIVFSNNSLNEVSIYRIDLDSLFTRSLEGPLVGKGKSYRPPSQVDFESSQRWEVDRKMNEDISFGKLNWDAGRQQYYRFAYKQKFGEEKEEWGAYIPTSAEVFLSVFDKDLELLTEVSVPEIRSKVNHHFVKDSKIWIFENMDDEMAFVRLSIK